MLHSCPTGEVKVAPQLAYIGLDRIDIAVALGRVACMHTLQTVMRPPGRIPRDTLGIRSARLPFFHIQLERVVNRHSPAAEREFSTELTVSRLP
jgi:hypothetical protein